MKEQFTRFLGLATDKSDVEEVRMLPVDNIVPNKYQPRSIFDDDKIDELCQTIKTHGVIQPIVVREVKDEIEVNKANEANKHYEIIAGERRWRACTKLGLQEIPAIIRNLSDTQSASVALIENLQRENLTSIEEATAYQRLIDLHNLTQESLAQRLGKGQSTVANKLRLLHLPIECHEALMRRQITERHARALLILKDEEIQLTFLREILEKDLNVKQTEDRIHYFLNKQEEPAKKTQVRKSFSKDMRLAMNTIRQSVDMVLKSGLTIETDEKDYADYYEFTIKIPKN